MSVLPSDLAVQAACRGKGPWPWITPESCDRDMFNRAAIEAREICNTCPIRKECRVAGLTEPRGTWGGVTFRERGY